MRHLFIFLLAISYPLSAISLAQKKTDFKGIVPGEELGWEIKQLEASIVVTKRSILNLQIYSPGFDPSDYRSALKGKEELGDERYDKGKGKVEARFVLSRDKTLLVQQSYGVEPSRWVLFFRGEVEPGIYSFSSSLSGNAKNAFRLRAQTSVPDVATIVVNPSLRTAEGRSMALFNVFVPYNKRGKEWVEPFAINASPEVLPLRVGFYDEDGPAEMLGRVRLPGNTLDKRLVSGDREWAYYSVKQAGINRFGFTLTPQSKQYSNTIGFWLEGCVEVDGDLYKAVPPRPIVVLAVDVAGQAVQLPYKVTGSLMRELQLGDVPSGWRLKDVQSEGGEQVNQTQMRFGCAGGSARIVLERLPEPPKPEPIKPEPVKPEPVVVQPLKPEPPKPEPIKVEPPKPEPVKPEPVKPQPEPIKPEPPKPEPIKVEPPKPEPVVVEPVKPEPPKPEPVKPEPVVVEPVKVEPPKPEPLKEPEPPKPEPVKPEPVKVEPIPQPEPVKPEPPKPEPEPVKPEPAVVEPVKPEPIKPEPVKPRPIQPGVLEITAVLVLPTGEQPYNLPIRVDHKNLRTPEGQLDLELPPALYKLTPAPLGARVEGPEQIQLESGQTAKAHYRIFPEVKLWLEIDRNQVYVGEEVWLTAKANTTFSDLLPSDLNLMLPQCLESGANLRTAGSVTASREVVLRIPARVVCKGEFVAQARLAPWNQQAQVMVRAIQPATFTLQKQAVGSEVAVGSEAVFNLRIANTGDEAGEVRLIDALPAGLEGQAINQVLKLEAGETKTLELRTRVMAQASDTLINTARLVSTAGTELAQAEASIRVLRPKAELLRELDKKLVVPGEEVLVSLYVRNPSRVSLVYTLSDTHPEWLQPLDPVTFKGEIGAGEQATHTYWAKVLFGAPATGNFVARLVSNGGNLSAPDQIQRVLLGLEKKVEPQQVILGNPAEFVVKLSNPLPRKIGLSLREAPDPALAMELPEDLNLALGAGEIRELRFMSKPVKLGELINQATVFVGETPASERVKATLKVLPMLEARRISTIKLDFKVLRGQGDRLLITHKLPEGSAYEPGSARLDGNPMPEPKMDKAGRLYFETPYQSSGQISYLVRHREGLPPIEKSTLTLRSGEREIFLQGEVPFSALGNAKPIDHKDREGLIREPLPGTVFRTDKTKVVVEALSGAEISLSINGQAITSRNLGLVSQDANTGKQRIEYYGIPLQPGSNIIEAKGAVGSDRIEVFLAGKPTHIEVRPVRLLADGRTPLEFEIRVLDKNGLTTGFGPLTALTYPEPIGLDAFPRESGYQLLVRDGVAVLRLKPLTTPGTVNLELAFDKLETQAEFFVVGKQGSLSQIQASVGVRIGDTLQLFALARGYLEAPLDGGTLQAAADGAIRWNSGVPQIDNGLAVDQDPSKTYPLIGGATEARLPLRSDDPVAFRYDQQNFSLSYQADALKLPGVTGLPQATALRVETRGDLSLQAFVGYLPLLTQTEEIVPDGTRIYRIAGPAQTGSEVVYLQVGANQGRLERLKDYVLDGPTGLLTLAKPLWPTTSDFQQVRLKVIYAPAGAARELGYGAGARYKSGGFSLGAGAAYVAGLGWRYGAELGYQEGGFSLRSTYTHALTDRYTLDLAYKGDALQAQGNLTYENRLQGQAQVQLNLSKDDSFSLEHQASGQDNRTGLLYQRRFGENFSLGAGLGYTWETLSTNVLARVAYVNGAFNTTLTHAQPFSIAHQAQTRLRSSYAFDFNLSLESDLVYSWGNSFSGVVGLKQKLAGANLSLSYQLPGASGEGNRARFGLEAPLPLSENWSLNASAGYEYGLSTNQSQSAFGLVARYQSKEFAATLGGETALKSNEVKVVVRGGAAGQIDTNQTLSVDATYEVVPSVQGSFTAAYALRTSEVSLLTYHRLVNGLDPKLEGGLAINYSPTLNFQLRPSAAYLVPFNNSNQSIYQLGLGANWYLTDWLGIGGGFYQMFQLTGNTASAFNVEGSLRIIEGLWFNLGYTFGGFSGLSPDTYPGLYMRLDFLGGSR